jgi:hypothetical protein
MSTEARQAIDAPVKFNSIYVRLFCESLFRRFNKNAISNKVTPTVPIPSERVNCMFIFLP